MHIYHLITTRLHIVNYTQRVMLSRNLFDITFPFFAAGSDPATFELIQKIQTLQRRLISKTEEVSIAMGKKIAAIRSIFYSRFLYSLILFTSIFFTHFVSRASSQSSLSFNIISNQYSCQFLFRLHTMLSNSPVKNVS